MTKAVPGQRSLVDTHADAPHDAALEAEPVAVRVARYNAGVRTLAALVADVSRDPALAPQLVLAGEVEANDYNPNKVAERELALLETSIRADGLTMAVVTVRDEARGRSVVVDGFHRTRVLARLGRAYVPCVEVARAPAERMAATVRHNRARGKHQVDLMGQLLKRLLDLGLDDAAIGRELGMSEEEVLRLRQMVGAARALAGERYTRCWEQDP